MKVCSFCGERNEDWMDICQRCGNSIKNADYNKDEENEMVVEDYNNNQKYTSKKSKSNVVIELESDDKEDKKVKKEKPKKEKSKIVIENLDLKLILIILVLILITLIIYTISTFI